jgi:hypothetical protein
VLDEADRLKGCKVGVTVLLSFAVARHQPSPPGLHTRSVGSSHGLPPGVSR